MELKFTKMHGCGNDYIYMDGFNQKIEAPEALALRLSDRHFGIGGDGLILILPSDVADARMRMFNSDGSEGKMCGNATRCVAKFLYEYNLVRKTEMTIETLGGIKKPSLTVENGLVTSVKVHMGPALLEAHQIPVLVPGDCAINTPVQIGGKEYHITCVSFGNPHAVVFCDDVDSLNLPKIGPLFEHSPIFPEGVNTEFVQILGRNHLKMRVWERGSGETLACGSGACAAAVAAVLAGACDKNHDITVDLIGGALTINYTDEAVYMTGPCQKVFEGVVEV